MKHILAIAFITLLALGTGCAWISPSSQTTSSDGINVHGHWTVTVTNPDGTLDAVHEFDNWLHPEGLLTALISGTNNIESHALRIQSTPGPLANYTPMTCVEDYTGFPESSQVSFIEANVIVEESENPPLVLTATCTVKTYVKGYNSLLSQVSTVLYDADKCITVWLGADDGMGCASWPPEIMINEYQGVAYLTTHDMNPFLEVFDGQVLGFNVIISFN